MKFLIKLFEVRKFEFADAKNYFIYGIYKIYKQITQFFWENLPQTEMKCYYVIGILSYVDCFFLVVLENLLYNS